MWEIWTSRYFRLSQNRDTGAVRPHPVQGPELAIIRLCIRTAMCMELTPGLLRFGNENPGQKDDALAREVFDGVTPARLKAIVHCGSVLLSLLLVAKKIYSGSDDDQHAAQRVDSLIHVRSLFLSCAAVPPVAFLRPATFLHECGRASESRA